MDAGRPMTPVTNTTSTPPPVATNCEVNLATLFSVVVFLMYGLVCVIALCGNGLVVLVVTCSPRMRTATNYWLLNLAVGDILMTLLCVPFTFVSTLLLQYWPFGAQLCRLVSFSQAVSVMVSAYTLVAISIDRYVAIMWPLRQRLSGRQGHIAILVVWTFAVLTALPILLVTKLTQPERWHFECNRWVCREEWKSPKHRYYYSLTLMGLQYVAPLLVLVFTYARIGVVIWGKRTPGEAHNTRDQRMARSKRKMVKMMVAVVIGFTVCWLPFNTLEIVWTLNESLSDWAGLPALWFACHWLAMSHSCQNPLIYCWMNARFRQSFQTVLHLPRARQVSRPATPATSCPSLMASRKVRNGLTTGGNRTTMTLATAEDVM